VVEPEIVWLVPVSVTVLVPAVKVPELEKEVPVPDKVIVEALAVRVPPEAIVKVVPDKARLVPSEVFKVPLTVIAPSTAEFTFMVTVCPAATVTVSEVVGTWPQSQVPAVFQLPVAKEMQAVGVEKFHPLPAVATA
jgi:hypothetical protein